jgi:hypothetical protein
MISATWNAIAGTIRAKWTRHRQTLFRGAIVVMAAIAAWRMGQAFYKLFRGIAIGDTTKFYHVLVRKWFASLPVYELDFAVHPPATYAILRPFFDWPDIANVRMIWLAATILALLWLAHLVDRESKASTNLERAFIALLPFSMYAMALTVRIGQLGVHVMPLLLAGLLCLRDRPPSWRRDLLSAALLLLALVKPTVAAPFVWIALFLPGGLRPAALVAAGYLALTFFAASYQPEPLPALFYGWKARSAHLAESAGTTHLHLWLAAVGLGKWILPASFVMLAGLGWWIYRHRRADLWLLIGVTAIVARFWTYHRDYDDVLFLLPAVALFRLAASARSAGNADVAAGSLLAVAAGAMLVQIRVAISPAFAVANAVLWFFLLLFLLQQAGRERNNRSAPSELAA